MSSLLKGLAAIRANQEAQKAKQEARERPKADWFKWPKNVNVATATFLQELDESASGFNPDRGLAVIAVEHQAPGPDGYKRRGLCTHDSEGQCYPCERHKANYEEGWRPRQNFYVDALVDFGDGERKHVVISRNANASFTHALIEEAVDENSITNNTFKITRVGEGTGTQWLLKRTKDDAWDSSDVEANNLEEVALRAVPYDQQAKYYGAVYSDSPAASGEGSSSAAPDEDW